MVGTVWRCGSFSTLVVLTDAATFEVYSHADI